MAGDNTPYHLRTNKFIEREIFCDLLACVGKWQALGTYLYTSMGGAYLADFKRLKVKCDNVKGMVSIEKEMHVITRQEFNKPPLTEIICENIDSAKFIYDLEKYTSQSGANNIIVWLDYADANARQVQIRELLSLLHKLGHNDIAKITLNCSARTLCDEFSASSAKEKQMIIYENLKKQLGELFDEQEFSPADMNNRGVCRALISAVRNIAFNALEGARSTVVRPLSIARYKDGPHEMLTISMIILDQSDVEAFDKCTAIADWHLSSKDWDDCKIISVPELSFREREKIDALIHSDASITSEEIAQKLNFSLDRKEKETINSLDAYMVYREYCPYVFLSRSADLPDAIKQHAEHLL